MAFFNGEGIDLPTITKLAEAGFSLKGMATITGHSRTGIKRALERNKIPFINHVRERFIIVDGVEISLGEACKAKGFSREAMYSFRVKRGLGLQEGFDAYVIYQQSKHAIDKPILTFKTLL